jgi:hypothetical protein
MRRIRREAVASERGDASVHPYIRAPRIVGKFQSPSDRNNPLKLSLETLAVNFRKPLTGEIE